jgi:hypothetical protein
MTGRCTWASPGVFCSLTNVRSLPPDGWRGSTPMDMDSAATTSPKEVPWATSTRCKVHVARAALMRTPLTPRLDVSRADIPTLQAKPPKYHLLLSTRAFPALGAWGTRECLVQRQGCRFTPAARPPKHCGSICFVKCLE